MKILKNMCDSDRITYFLACFGQSQDMIRHIFHTFLKDTRNDEPKQNPEASNKSIYFSPQVQRCERNQQDPGLAQKNCIYGWGMEKIDGHEITIIELWSLIKAQQPKTENDQGPFAFFRRGLNRIADLFIIINVDQLLE